jgi:4-hydroxy-tetrahydrodipicolinate reductase
VTPGASPAIRTVIVGAAGRMGRQLLSCLAQFPPLVLHGAIVREGSEAVGRAVPDSGMSSSMRFTTDVNVLLKNAQLVIDFSSFAAAEKTLAACRTAGVPLLIGATGLSPEFEAQINSAASSIAVMPVANTSLGVNLLLHLVRQAARQLPPGYDIEIVETHHRGKRDAPSGTALALAQAAAEGRGIDLAEHAVTARPAVGDPRDCNAIGMFSVRGGDVVGEHEVRFLGDGEQVRLAHSATDRSVFARGALIAGRWLSGQPAGRYTMASFFNCASVS